MLVRQVTARCGRPLFRPLGRALLGGLHRPNGPALCYLSWTLPFLPASRPADGFMGNRSVELDHQKSIRCFACGAACLGSRGSSLARLLRRFSPRHLTIPQLTPICYGTLPKEYPYARNFMR